VDLITAMAGHFVFTAFWQQGLRQGIGAARSMARSHEPPAWTDPETQHRFYQDPALPVARRH